MPIDPDIERVTQAMAADIGALWAGDPEEALLDASPVPIPSVQRKRRADRRLAALSA